MNTHELLRANCEKLWNLYKTNLDDLKALQSTLVDDILPHLAFELELDDQHVIWATEWLEDTSELFPCSSSPKPLMRIFTSIHVSHATRTVPTSFYRSARALYSAATFVHPLSCYGVHPKGTGLET